MNPSENTALDPVPNAATGMLDASSQRKGETIRDCVERTMTSFFADLDGHDAKDVYQMVLSEMEAPLLEVVMTHTRNNQSRAAEVLGLNRGTLRKKLKQYGML